MKKLAMLLIRGSGSPGFKSQEEFLNKLFKKLDRKGMPREAIEYQFLDWYTPLESQQLALLDRLEDSKTPVKGMTLRTFLLTNIADLINYRGGSVFNSTSYHEVHTAVHRDIKKLQAKVEENTPLVIIASSMGTEIINNHIWDRQHWLDKNEGKPDPFGASPFERLETLIGLFTLGNNIPIFASTYKIDDLKPINFPGKALSNQHKARSFWENIYDKNDPMGYPIKFINTHYKLSSLKDIEINVGGLLTFWNLGSHLKYWSSNRLRNHISDRIFKLWQVL